MERVEPFCLAEACLKQELTEVLPAQRQRAGAGSCTCKELDHADVSSLVLPPGTARYPKAGRGGGKHPWPLQQAYCSDDT